MSYARLLHQLRTTAAQLNRLGLTRTDRIAIVLPQGPELGVAFLSVASATATVLLDPTLPRSELESCLERLRVHAVLAEADNEAVRIAAGACGLRILGLVADPDGIAGAFRLADADPGDLPPPTFSTDDDVAVVVTTSGTTARPKMIPLTHRNLCTGAEHHRVALQLVPSDRCLSVMPLFHAAGLMALLGSLTAGGSCVVTPRFDDREFLGWLRDSRATWYTASPTMHQAILARVPPGGPDPPLTSLRLIRAGAAGLSPPLRSRLEETFGVPVIEAYSTSETLQMTSTPLQRERHKAGSVGLPLGVDLAVMDADGALLPAGGVGEIVCKGPSVFSGYEDAPEGNVAAFRNGWFRTGDEGYRDADGYLFVTRRLKEQINRGGQKVSPEEVDSVLLTHPAVAEAATYAVAHPSLGEDVAAAIVVRPGHSVSPHELRRFVAARLAAFKVPRRIVIVTELPLGPTGKVVRRALAESCLASATPSVPPRTELESRLVELWERAFGIEPIGVTDDFFDLGGDSLLAAALMSDMEAMFGPVVTPTTLFEAPTIRDMARIIEAGPPRHATLLKVLQTGSDRAPFVMVDGDVYGDGALYCVRLARLLGPDQPFFTLSSHGTNGGAIPPTIEAMASDHVRTLSNVLPDGPYLLGGFSHGGLVAFEMARQLAAAGHQVPLLVVVDIRAKANGRLAEAVGRHYRRSRRRLASLVRMVRSACDGDDGAHQRRVAAWRQRQWNTYSAIVRAYAPRRYAGTLTLVISSDGRARRSTTDPTLGWRRVVADVRAVVIPGDHLTCVTEHTDVLARHIADALTKAPHRRAATDRWATMLTEPRTAPADGC